MVLFNASIETIFWRFHLLILVVVLPWVFGLPLLSLLAVPVFLSALLGVSFKNWKPNTNTFEERIETSSYQYKNVSKSAA